jgi:hypothetical protein
LHEYKEEENSKLKALISKEMVRPPGTNRKKPPTEAGFPVPTSGTEGYGKTETEVERTRIP